MILQNQIRIPSPVHGLLSRLNKAGFSAYAVGGCVRDSLLGNSPKDWDLCTSARPEEIKACFSDHRTILTGERYGTVTVLHENLPYEITTFRTESGYSDNRHPNQVAFLDSLQGDLARRDFTVNAMAADAEGNITDCFGGLEDLEKGQLRCVGNAKERFSEDALRILRALRFSSRLGFSIEPKSADAIHALKDQLHAVAPERLRKELCGLLCGSSAGAVARAYADVLCVLIPELRRCIGFRQYNYHHLYDVWEHTLRVLEQVPAEEDLRLAALLHDIGKPAAFTMDKQLVGHFYGHAVTSAALSETILRRLRYDNTTLQQVTFLVREHCFILPEGNEKRMRKLLAAFGTESLRKLLLLRRADAIGTGTRTVEEADHSLKSALRLLDEVLRKEDCFSLKQLAVNGADLMALGLPQGPRIGSALAHLLDAVIDGRVQNTRAELLSYAQKMNSLSDTDS